jgi:hypothetical protein
MQQRSDRSRAHGAAFEVLDRLDRRVLGQDRLQPQHCAAGQNFELGTLLDGRQDLSEAGQRAHVRFAGQQAADQLRAVRHMQDIGIKPQLLEYSFLLQQRGQHDIGVAGRVDDVDPEPIRGHQWPRRDQAERRRSPGAQDRPAVEARIEELARLRLGGPDHGDIRPVILRLAAIESLTRLISFFRKS